MSAMLEEFPGLTLAQIEGDEFLRLLRIVETRQYARAVDAIESHANSPGAKSKDAPDGPMIDLVCEIQGERIRLAEEYGDNC